MSFQIHWRLRLPTTLLLSLGLAACGNQANTPAAPELADPAPPAAVSTAEDRGHAQESEPADPAAADSAFTNIESGDAERAASKRGRESAGEPAPAATAPGSGP
jgi:hypothetical protein